MPEIDFTTHCTACSRVLDADVSYRGNSVSIYVEVCPNCMEVAKLEGVQEGKDIAESEAAQ